MPYNLKGIIFILCLFLPFNLAAKIPKNVEAFKTLPRSIAKDYYIYRYLREKNINSVDATTLLGEAKRVNFKLFHLFAKKIDDKDFKKVSTCLKLKTKELLKTDDDCIAMGLSIKDALSLDKKKIKNLAFRLKNYRDINKTLQMLSLSDVSRSYKKNPKKFLEIFNAGGDKYRKKLFNNIIDKEDISALSEYKSFNKAVELTLTQRDLLNVQKSLLLVSNNPNLSQKSLFFLGLNALEFNKKKLALDWFDLAYKKAYFRFDKDKILFWQYLVTKNRTFIDELMSSFDVNIYTIYAHELTSKKFNNIMQVSVKNKNKKYDIQNPFLWTNLLREIKDKNSSEIMKIAQKYRYKNTIGQYSFLLERSSRYKNSYFPVPFDKYLKKYSTKRASLILALARQESRFVPASVSTSYALGMMQFMPFLARAVAKEKNIGGFDLDNMFDPKTAYKFANIHLNYLSKYLYHPLFIAYAYNGGIGYVKRLLKSGYFFQKAEFEPYLSMELISYPQTRRYGKKVLANYVIYMQLLGEKVSLSSLFQTLTQPANTDIFRH